MEDNEILTMLLFLIAFAFCPVTLLKVHFRAYPSDILQPLRGEEALQASYFNSLKEAAYVLTGNSNAVMSLTKKSQEELWKNVLQVQHEDFFKNMNKLDLTKPMVRAKSSSSSSSSTTAGYSE